MDDSQGLFGQLESGCPLPPVNPDDLKRVWHIAQTLNGLTDQTAAAGPGCVGIDAGFIAEQCEPATNVEAVVFRGALLQYLVQSGLLDEWREGDTLSDSVFQAGATFPVKIDAEFDLTAFIFRLRECKNSADNQFLGIHVVEE